MGITNSKRDKLSMRNTELQQDEHILQLIRQNSLRRPATVYYHAYLRRLNRTLAQRGEVIRKTRNGNRYQAVLGEHYLVDLESDKVLKSHVDIEEYVKKYQVLKDWETLPR